MPGRTVIHQQSTGPIELEAQHKRHALLHCAVCHPGCHFACSSCQCCIHLAYELSTSFGGCTNRMFLFPLVFAWVQCLLEEPSSILHLVAEIICLTCPFGSCTCFPLDFDFECFFFLVELACFVDPFPFDHALACLPVMWRA